ncbi:MAG: bifunctional phosphoglucose/phosphomannose isomerase, partial [Chloroflexi bacterium]|nr:bifunctional phosphoglucose/phosphomannose isomerase [Chloroflexota bacterium]
HGLLRRIESLPEQCAFAWRQAAAFELPDGYPDARELVVLGMGGSAMAGDILRSLAAISGRKRVSVVRGYDLPPFIDEETLVVACSHSGETEETLSAFQQALASGRSLAVTTGGRLQELAQERGVPIFMYEYDGEPRSALGHQLMALLAVGERAEVLEPQGSAVAEAVGLMQKQRGRLDFAAPAERNQAKQLAARLHGRLPVVVGAGALTEAAHRWKTQLNENSKVWALYEELPELDHNAIVGFGLPQDVAARLHVVFLWHPSLHSRVLLRYEATEEALTEAGVSHERVEAHGSSQLAQVLTTIYLGDLVSYYLGLLSNVEPSPVTAIDRLKARLAGH